jgi:cytochrome c oxidase assembly protein subunit 15
MRKSESGEAKLIRAWFGAVSVMIIIMAVIGGITRLSRAGLSIVEWEPITGIIPPLSEKDWEEEFEKYKKIAQYRVLHHWMSIDDFKKIYLIEYIHRLWGRIVGLSLIIPAIIFAVKKKLSSFTIKYVLFLSILFFVQGVIGWLMVKTGVEGERIFVSPLALAGHNTFALIVYSFVILGIYIVKAKEGSVRDFEFQNPKDISLKISKLKKLSLISLVLFFVQFFFGTLLAGTKGAVFAPTYPDINGKLIPSNLLEGYILENPFFVNFVHRHFSIVLLIPLIFLAFERKFLPFIIWIFQFALGIITLLKSKGEVPILLGAMHQVTAWILYTSIITVFFESVLSYRAISYFSGKKEK